MAASLMNVRNSMLAVAAYYEDRVYPCGTAFLVGPSLAVTAAHVVDQPFDCRVYSPPDPENPDFGIIAIQRVNKEERGLCWRVESEHRFPAPWTGEDDDYEATRPVDVAVLKLVPLPPLVPELEDWRRSHLEVNVAPPSVGSMVTAFGFTRSDMNAEPIDSTLLMCSNVCRVVQGTVTDVFFPRRDRSMLVFPCFGIEGDFHSGMSGGPIFNDRGQVCGVVISGGIPGVCHGAVLWPILGVEVDGRRLLDLAAQGHIRAANHHCVTIHPDPAYEFPGITFNPNLIRE
jgi:hypothetical protein